MAETSTRQPIPVAEFRDVDGKPAGGAFMLPAREGTCETCAAAHTPDQPHNAQSLFYGMRFQIEHGRAPTWLDAMAHCAPEVQAAWKQELERLGVDVDGGKLSPPAKARNRRSAR